MAEGGEGKVGTSSTSSTTTQNSHKSEAFKDAFKTRSPGWGPATSAFKAINFELFIKPNKYVMAVGVVLFSGCVTYIAYMNLTDDKRRSTYVTLDSDGGTTVRPKTSKWH